DLNDASFKLPVFLLAIAQFTRTFPGEVLGLNLAWQFLGLSAFGPALVQELCDAYGLPALGKDLDDSGHFEKGRELAQRGVEQFLEAPAPAAQRWKAIMRGAAAGAAAWNEWLERTRSAAPSGPPDPRQEMIDLLWRK